MEVAEGRLVPFVGSGVSRGVDASQFPSWSGLLTSLAQVAPDERKQRIIRDLADDGDLYDAAEKAIKFLGMDKFHSVMKRIFGARQSPQSNLAVPTALWGLKPKLIVTTNYDRVLTWANDASQIVTNDQPANLAKLFQAKADVEPFVWHLHGHIDNPDSLILAPSQYESLYREPFDDQEPYAAARSQLRTLFSNDPLLFVGFGLEDKFVMDSLTRVLQTFNRNLRTSYAILDSNDPRETKLWDDYGIRVVPYKIPDNGDRVTPLSELIQSIGHRSNEIKKPGQAPPRRPLEIPTAYRRWLQEECADVTPFGLNPTQGQSVCLQEVYVPMLTIARSFDRGHGLLAELAGKETKPRRRGRKVQTSGDDPADNKPQLLLELLGKSSLYVSGNPGTGKSTFCRWIAWCVAHGTMPQFKVPDLDEFKESLPRELIGRLPLLIPLREFADHLPIHPGDRSMTSDQFEQALKSWVSKKNDRGLDGDVVDSFLQANRLLLILDGVDEMPIKQEKEGGATFPRESFLAGLIAACQSWWDDKTKPDQKNRVLITSRPYGLEPDQVPKLERAGLPQGPLEPLPDELQSLLTRRWFMALPKTSREGEKKAAELRDDVASLSLSGDIRSMTANPLLLTAICAIYSEGGKLPKNRHDLYERIVTATLGCRYPRDLDAIDKARGRLTAVALGMHTGESTGTIRQSPAREVHETEIDQILGKFKNQSAESEQWMEVTAARNDLLHTSGLLYASQHAHAAFSHWSFQEFLAAERMMRLNYHEDNLLEQFECWSKNKSWRPTLSFLLDRRIAQGWESARDLLMRMVARIEKDGVSALPDLAVTVADGIGLLLDRGLDLRHELLASVRRICQAGIEQRLPLESRVELGFTLSRIGDRRVATNLKDSDCNDVSIWVTVPAGTYPLGDAELAKHGWGLKPEDFPLKNSIVMSRFPVTNHQFAAFVADGGYQKQEYWKEGWDWRQRNNVNGPAIQSATEVGHLTQPVVGVSWYEAAAYCEWAGCRLPPEREWEAAARGTTGTVYPWGNEWCQGYCNTFETIIGKTTPVGLFPESRASCGAEEMSGNVWQWCNDYFDENKRIDRVLRGGSWGSGAKNARSAHRSRVTPDGRYIDVGFRVIR